MHQTEMIEFNGSSQKGHSIMLGIEGDGNIFDDPVQVNQQTDDSIVEPFNFGRASSTDVQTLEAKLRELKAEKARRLKDLDLESLDEDIMAVERILKLVKSRAA